MGDRSTKSKTVKEKKAGNKEKKRVWEKKKLHLLIFRTNKYKQLHKLKGEEEKVG